MIASEVPARPGRLRAVGGDRRGARAGRRAAGTASRP